MKRSLTRYVAAALAAGLAVAACTSEAPDDEFGNGTDDPGDCIVVDLSVSSEKIELLTRLAEDFNGSDEAVVGDDCVFARVQSKASGGATQLLASEWDEDAEGPRPVIWSPASSSLGLRPQPATSRSEQGAADR